MGHRISGESSAGNIPVHQAEIERYIYFDNFSVFSRSNCRSNYLRHRHGKELGSCDPYRSELDHMGQCDSQAMLDQLLAADLKTYLHELLMKQDQMSMSASIEKSSAFPGSQARRVCRRLAGLDEAARDYHEVIFFAAPRSGILPKESTRTEEDGVSCSR